MALPLPKVSVALSRFETSTLPGCEALAGRCGGQRTRARGARTNQRTKEQWRKQAGHLLRQLYGREHRETWSYDLESIQGKTLVGRAGDPAGTTRVEARVTY